MLEINFLHWLLIFYFFTQTFTTCIVYVWQHIPLRRKLGNHANCSLETAICVLSPFKHPIRYHSSLLVLLGSGDKILEKLIDRVFQDTKTTKQYLKLENKGLLGTTTGGSVYQV